MTVGYLNNRLSQEECLPNWAKSSKLLSIDEVLAVSPDNSWNIVRLPFEDFDIDANNRLTTHHVMSA